MKMKENKLYKRLLISAIAIFMILSVANIASAAYVEIGVRDGYEWYCPHYGYYDYGWNECIYRSFEIGPTAFDITAISYKVDHYTSSGGTVRTFENQDIYMSTTLDNDYTYPYPQRTTVGKTQVFHGDVTWDGLGWQTITLDTPFHYDGTSNLRIMWDNWDGDGGYPYPYWDRDSTSPDNCIIYHYSSTHDPSGCTYAYSSTSYRPIIRLHYEFADDVGPVDVDPKGYTLIDTDPENVNIQVEVENFGTNDRPPGVPVTAEVWSDTIVTIIDENMDTDPGWTTTGVWEYGTPVAHHTYDGSVHTGTNVYGTDLDADYPTYASDDLTTPIIDLSTFSSATLDYWMWYDTESTSFDGIEFQISHNAGPFTTVALYGAHVQKFWENIIFDLTPYCGGTVELRWHLYSDSSIVYPGAFIDDVKVSGASSTLLSIHTGATTTTLTGNAKGDSEVVTLIPAWSATPGDYHLEVYTSLGGDQDSSNDYLFEPVEVLLAVHDVGVVSIDIGDPTPGVPFEPKATIENIGTQPESFNTEFWITTDLQMFESWENPILMAGHDPEIEETSFETYTEKGEEFEHGVMRYPVFRESTGHEPRLGHWGDWFPYEIAYYDGVSWLPTSSNYYSPETSIYAQAPPYSYCYDTIQSPIINVGVGFEGIMKVYFYSDVIDTGAYPATDYLTIWNYDPTDGSYLGYAYAVPGPGWYYAEFPIQSDQVDAAGDTYVEFQYRSDADGLPNTIWVDDVSIMGESVIYREYIWTDDLGISAQTQLTYPEFDPAGYTTLDFNARTLLWNDEDRSNDYMHMVSTGVGKVWNVDQDLWYLTIQDAIDDANPFEEIVALDGDFVEDVTVHVEGLIVHGMNPPLSTSTIYGTVDIIADGVLFEYFKVIPGGPITMDEAGIFVSANDVIVQECIIEDMTGLVSDTMFTVKGIHAYSGGYLGVALPCEYEVTLFDSYGDGWNGNYLDIYINGVLEHPGVTITAGSTGSFSFWVDNGDVIFIDFRAVGSWITECSYEIINSDGVSVGFIQVSAFYPYEAADWQGVAECPVPVGVQANNNIIIQNNTIRNIVNTNITCGDDDDDDDDFDDFLCTQFAGGNGFAGNWFDVTATNDLTIVSFDVNIDAVVHNMEVWYKPGTFQGFESNQAAWTLLGSATVTGLGNGVPTPVPIGGLSIPAGQTYGLYVCHVEYSGMDYTNMPTPTYFTNADMTIKTGSGGGYWGSVFAGRSWNGCIYYSLPKGGGGKALLLDEGFEPAQPAVWPPAGWTTYGTDVGWKHGPSMTTYGGPNTGDGWAYSDYAETSVLETPLLELECDSQLSFWYASEGAYYDQILLEVYVNGILEWDDFGFSEVYQQAIVDLSAYDETDVVIEFVYDMLSYYGGACIDDVQVETYPCGEPPCVSLYGGAVGIMVQGYLDEIDVLHNSITNVHSAGWSYGVEVTPTAAEPPTPPSGCEWEVCLYDIYGDGWDWTYYGPNTLDVLVNGIVVLDDISLFDGYGPDCYSFAVEDGDLVEMIYTEVGWFPDENYYEIYDGDGALVDIVDCYYTPYYATDAYCPVGGPVGGAPPQPQNVMVEKNYFREIGNGSMYDVWNNTMKAPYPGVMFSLDEIRDPTGAVIVPGDASGVTVYNNFFDNNCQLPILGLINKDLTTCIDARANYWGDKLGPASYPEGEVFDCDTGDEADANDLSTSIVNYGPVAFMPYVGVHAEASPETASVETGQAVYFDGSGSWVQPMGVKPASASASCEWEVCLYDSYGDGWDLPPYGGPNTLDVIVDGIVVLDDIYLAAGSGPDCYTFDVFEGSTVECDYTGIGDWITENSYTVFDNDGIAVVTINCVSSSSDWTGFAYCGGGGGAVAPDPEYYWTFEPTIHSMDKTIAYAYDSAGTYDVSLRVMGHGLGILHAGVNGLPSSKHAIWPNFMFDWDYCKIIVNNPTASLSANADGGNLGGYVTVVGEPVQFYGVASGGQEPYSYEWDLADGHPNTREQNPTTVYREEGTYTVTLTIFDITGAIATDTSEVLVQGEAEILVNAGGPYNTVVDQTVFFTGTAAGGKAPYGYLWDFGDGSHGASSTPFHVYEEPGIYTVTLTVTDSEDKVKTTTATVTVEAAGSTSVVIKDVRGGVLVTAVIQAGDTPADWTITVEGTVFFGGEASGTIPANMQASVKLPITLGFGKVDITVTANGVQDKYSAFMIGPFVINVQEV